MGIRIACTTMQVSRILTHSVSASTTDTIYFDGYTETVLSGSTTTTTNIIVSTALTIIPIVWIISAGMLYNKCPSITFFGALVNWDAISVEG